MKKLLYSAFMLFAIAASFVACREDMETGLNPAENDHPELKVEGLYSGTWTRILDKDTVYEAGNLKLTPTDSIYCVDVTVDCATFTLTETSVANIAQEGSHGFVYYNTSGAASGLGVSFRGYVKGETATINFIKTIKSGRKSYEYKFAFSGEKVVE